MFAFREGKKDVVKEEIEEEEPVPEKTEDDDGPVFGEATVSKGESASEETEKETMEE